MQGGLMPAHRSHGDGGLYYDGDRKRWTAEITVGYSPSGKRIVRKARATTKAAAQRKLKEMLRDHDDGLAIGPQNFTVANAVRDWLEYGLTRRDSATVRKCCSLADRHIIPELGARKLRELSADDVDRWLAIKAKGLSTDTLRQLRSILKRAVARAQARDKVKRNVVLLCDVPAGRPGRPSKAFNLDQAEAVVDASVGTAMYAYIVLSILIGARTEELRALAWDHVDLEGSPKANPAIPPSIMVWRSVRAGGETKTRQSPAHAGSSRAVRGSPHLPPRLPGPAEGRGGLQGGMSMAWCSPPPSGHSATPITCSGPSGRSSNELVSTRPSGLPARCGTASYPCCRTLAYPSRTSPAWSATLAGPT